MVAPNSSNTGPWTATDAANYTFDRLFEEARIDGASDGEGSDAANHAPQDLPDERLRARATAARVVDGYADLFLGIFRSLTSDLTSSLSEPGDRSVSGQAVAIIGNPGSSAGAVIWIHNVGATYVPELTLRLTDMWHASGSRLSAAVGSIEPSRFAGSVEPRRAAWVGVEIPSDAHRGSYHGYVLADGVPHAVVPVSLFVR